jgi:hypothetical protein
MEKKMNNHLKNTLILVLIFSTILFSACKTLSREEAIAITQDFVDKQVKFYVNEANQTPTIDKASITVLTTQKKGSNWEIYLNIKSNQTGELKQKNVLVLVDARSGQIKGMR